MRGSGILLTLGLGLTLAMPARAQMGMMATPPKDVSFDQKMGAAIPMDATFRDEMGKAVKLGDFFGKRPVVVQMVYYGCPMICGMAMSGLAGSFKALKFDPGQEFEIVTISIDPTETAELASQKKASTLNIYRRPGGVDAWHFLTGKEAEIKKVADAIGFRFVYDEATRQYAHATGVVIATPEGKVSRYLFGIDVAPKDVRLGLIEAADGKIGNPIDQVLLLCYQYNPKTGTYAATALRVMRLGGVVTVVALAIFLFVMLRGERRVAKSPAVALPRPTGSNA